MSLVRCLSSTSSSEEAADIALSALKKDPEFLQKVLERGGEPVRAQLAKALKVELADCTVDSVFIEADVDQDGYVTKAEFQEWAAAQFGKVDVDHSGTLSRRELQQWVRRRRLLPPAAEGEADAASEDAGAVEPPSREQLRRLKLNSFVPFVGFGFLDNAIMLTAGDQIDAVFGATLGLSALAAAGLGNLVSDVAGIQAGSVIERVARRMGLPESGLSMAQSRTKEAMRATALASALGISVGCLLGMAPLLLLEDAETRATRDLFVSIDTAGTGSITLGELEASLTQLGIGFNRSQLAKVFEEIDADRSRSLSLEEFRDLTKQWRSLATTVLQDPDDKGAKAAGAVAAA